MLQVDWAKMVAQGRAKDIGVSWTEEEVRAVFLLKIPADYVRKGILTVEAYQAAISGKEKDPVDAYLKLSGTKLFKMARSIGIEATPDASKETLVRLIREKEAANPPAAAPGPVKEPKKPAEPKVKKEAKPKAEKKPAAKKAAKSKK